MHSLRCFMFRNIIQYNFRYMELYMTHCIGTD